MIGAVPLRFGIPEPPARPGELADFSYLDVPPAGSVPRPAVDTSPSDMRDLAYSLIRVLDDTGAAVVHGTAGRRCRGPRGSASDGDDSRLRRPHDHRAAPGQDVVLHALHRRRGDRRRALVGAASTRMFFPTYRQQGWLIARRWPLVDMMCQVLSNEKDRLHGRQMPIMYSARTRGSSRSRATWGRNTSRPSAGRWPPPSRATRASRPVSSARAPRPRPTSTTRSPSQPRTRRQ